METPGSEAMRAPILAATTPEKAPRPREVGKEWSPTVSASTATGSASRSGSSSRSTNSSECLDAERASPAKLLVAACTSPGEDDDRTVRVLDFGDADVEAGSGVSAFGPAAEADPTAAAVELLPVEGEGRVYWEGFFVNLPVFCGYAALFGLQHEIKSRFGITDSSSDASKEFGVACSFLYIFNLIFRFSHNVVFGFLGPRGRTLVAMTSMVAAMLVIAVPIMILESYHLGWVYLAYGLGGTAIGTFEGNLLCCLTPLGNRTKHVAITAIPVGISAVLIGGFFTMGPPLDLPVTAIYLAVAVACVLGMLVFVARIPHVTGVGQPGLRQFLGEAAKWREWLPQLWHYPLATMVNMFCLSAFSPGVALYIWDQKTVSLAGGLVLNKDTFFAVYNACNMLGGITGRVLSYRIRPMHPLVYVSLNVLGAALLLTKDASLAPLSTFLLMLGDGLIYGSITRHIDARVPKQFNLVAISFWLFVGDFGSVAGSNLISYIRDWVVGS